MSQQPPEGAADRVTTLLSPPPGPPRAVASPIRTLEQADDYAVGALSQRAAFAATHLEAMATARTLVDEPVLRVADLGAVDGVNSHGLIRELVAQRSGRALVYAVVDLPTNPWAVAADHQRGAMTGLGEPTRVAVLPAPEDAGPGVSDVGSPAPRC